MLNAIITPLQKVYIVFSMETTHIVTGCSIGSIHLQGKAVGGGASISELCERSLLVIINFVVSFVPPSSYRGHN